MNHILVSVFPDEGSAYQGLETLRELHRDGNITLYQSALLAKDADARVWVRESSERGPQGAAFGMTGGALAGTIGGPVGLAVGASVGAVVGALYDMFQGKMAADLISDVGRTLRPGTAALVIDADETSDKPVDHGLEALGAVNIRGTRREVVDEQLQREVDAANAELDQLEVELRDSDDVARAAVRQHIQAQVSRIMGLDERLQAEMDRLTAENSTRLAALRAQRELADEHHQARIDARIAAVKADHEERRGRLSRSLQLSMQATELAAEALEPDSIVI